MKRKGFLLILMLLLTLTCTALAEPLVRAGGSFGIAVDAQGGVWGWGDNANGQLGNGNNKRVYLPKAAAVGLNGTQIVDVQCGNVNTLFLMQDGTVYTCGYNNYGQQGLPEGGATGSGLGAVIIKQLARQFGGAADYSAREGGGTVVKVTLPNLAPDRG